MTFEKLTPEQQALVSTWVAVKFRPTVAAMARAFSALAALDLEDWQPTVALLVTGLDAGIVVPDQTGLAGAQTLISDDIVSLMTTIEALLQVQNKMSNRAQYNKIAGIVNTGS